MSLPIRLKPVPPELIHAINFEGRSLLHLKDARAVSMKPSEITGLTTVMFDSVKDEESSGDGAMAIFVPSLMAQIYSSMKVAISGRADYWYDGRPVPTEPMIEREPRPGQVHMFGKVTGNYTNASGGGKTVNLYVQSNEFMRHEGDATLWTIAKRSEEGVYEEEMTIANLVMLHLMFSIDEAVIFADGLRVAFTGMSDQAKSAATIKLNG